MEPVSSILDSSAPTKHPISAKEFRRRVLRPVEGVFLFHPRALERLIHVHLESGLLARRVPALSYYLIPRETFLVALEDENPDALSVIEGIELPHYVILLPTPLARERTGMARDRLLCRYWAQRYEAEVARRWQLLRDQQEDTEEFGGAGLERAIGAVAVREVRAVLEQDHEIILGRGSDAVCRQFVGRIARLRAFAPGLRPCIFPSIVDWPALDHWLEEGGLELTVSGGGLPPLLDRSRPSALEREVLGRYDLPLGFEPCQGDPDHPPQLTAESERRDHPPQSLPSPVTPTPGSSSTFAWEALQRRLNPPLGNSWSRLLTQLHLLLIGVLVDRFRPLMEPGVTWPARINPWHRTWARWFRQMAFAYELEADRRAEQKGRSGPALQHMIEAAHWYRALVCPNAAEPSESDRVWPWLQERQQQLADQVIGAAVETFDLKGETREAIGELIERLVTTPEPNRRHAHSLLIRELDKAVCACQSAFAQVRPLTALLSWGKQPLRLPLEYHGPLKALRSLRRARLYLNRLSWSVADLRRYDHALEQVEQESSHRLREQLAPLLARALEEAGFEPTSPRERIAFAKMRDELFDLLAERAHLRFSDLRDSVARNDMRLADPQLPELTWRGDKLSRLDRVMYQHLPGTYRRGEFYIKGFQKLASILFGSSVGRVVTRYLLLPFGITLLTLEFTAHLIHLVSHSDLKLLTPWSLLLMGGTLSFALNSEHGRRWAGQIGSAIVWVAKWIFVRSFQLLMQWGPIARLLENHTVRELSRYLVEPFVIGALILLPIALLLLLSDWSTAGVPWYLVLSGFLVGNFLRNTHRGRRMLDAVAQRLIIFWQQVRHTLITGLFRMVVDFSVRTMDAIEQALYRVEDRMRSRMEDSPLVLAAKIIVKPFWSTIRYVIQFYATVLVEPQVNPIKHFPVVTVSHKLMLPFLPAFTAAFLEATHTVLPRVIGYPFVTITIILLPGFFGFLVWELKENWNLYRSNEPPRIRPVLIGRHGETLRTLLRRGFHSGTVPKAFDKLRRILRKGIDEGAIRFAHLRKIEHKIMHARHSIEHFRDRELIASLNAALRNEESASNLSVEPGPIHLATQTLEIPLQIHRIDQPTQQLLLCYAVAEGELRAGIQLTDAELALERNEREILAREIGGFFERSAAQFDRAAIAQKLQLEEGAPE